MTVSFYQQRWSLSISQKSEDDFGKQKQLREKELKHFSDSRISGAAKMFKGTKGQKPQPRQKDKGSPRIYEVERPKCKWTAVCT